MISDAELEELEQIANLCREKSDDPVTYNERIRILVTDPVVFEGTVQRLLEAVPRLIEEIRNLREGIKPVGFE